jgi:CRP-like cAMP-binding protein
LLAKFARVSPKLKNRLESILVEIKAPKGTVLLDIGDYADYIYYIDQGLVMSYYIKDGKEVVNWFMKKGDLCISVNSFFMHVPSKEIIVTMKDCVLWAIRRDELDATYKKFRGFERNGRLITQVYYCRSEERLLFERSQTPIEKFTLMMKHYPDLYRDVPIKYLASYMNISQRTYNTTKKEYFESLKKGGKKGEN